MVRLVWFPGYMDWERSKYTWEIRGQNADVRGARSFAQCVSLVYLLIPSEARLYSRSIDIFRRRRRQPEVGLKTSISQEWCTGSLSDWQA